MDLCLVFTTWPADRSADEFAATLVAEGLAACVSILAPMISHYRWDGVLERTEERQIAIKTNATRLADLTVRLDALHPYEVPELLILDAAASATYGAWVAAAVARR